MINNNYNRSVSSFGMIEDKKLDLIGYSLIKKRMKKAISSRKNGILTKLSLPWEPLHLVKYSSGCIFDQG